MVWCPCGGGSMAVSLTMSVPEGTSRKEPFLVPPVPSLPDRSSVLVPRRSREQMGRFFSYLSTTAHTLT